MFWILFYKLEKVFFKSLNRWNIFIKKTGNPKSKVTIQVDQKIKNTNKKRYTQNNYSLISNIKNKTTTSNKICEINKKVLYTLGGYVGGKVFPHDTEIINIYNTPFNKQDYIPVLIHELGHILDLNYNKKFYHFTHYVGVSNSPE